MTAFDAVRSATVNAGAVLGARVGMIEPGYRADLLVFDTDPRTDVDVLRRPSRVISRGRVLSRAWLDDTIEEYAGVLA
jgi:imidazolonepropionase-like amidohydrolase